MASITIASVGIPGWQGNTSGISLRVYTVSDFTAESGTIYPRTVISNLKIAGLGSFFQSFACTVASGTLTIPAITLDSTTDSPDNPAASYSCMFWDSASGKPIQSFGTLPTFTLPASPTSTTWAAIYASEASS